MVNYQTVLYHMAEKVVKSYASKTLEMTPLEYAILFIAQSIQIIILTFVISKIMLVVPLLVALFKCSKKMMYIYLTREGL